MAETMEEEPLMGDVMDVRGVAQYLGFSPATIYNKVRDNDIPHVRIGNVLRFPKVEVDQWLTRNTVRPQESFYNYFVQVAGRFFFSRWLESQGLDPDNIDPDALNERAQQALEELKSHSEQSDFYVES